MKYLLLPLLLSGCAALPDYVGPELSHSSHALQHLQSPDPNYGSDSIGVTAEWSKGAGPYLELHEGVTLEPAWKNGGLSGHGETLGAGREEFQGRLGWRFKVAK